MGDADIVRRGLLGLICCPRCKKEVKKGSLVSATKVSGIGIWPEVCTVCRTTLDNNPWLVYGYDENWKKVDDD